jgi:hypothetical protein
MGFVIHNTFSSEENEANEKIRYYHIEQKEIIHKRSDRKGKANVYYKAKKKKKERKKRTSH